MIDRIREILSARQYTPTQFADTIGVARPIISHILSGRNKPSLEVVQKIVAAFPDLSLPWLLSGIGGMQAVADEPVGVATPPVNLPERRTGSKASETTRPALPDALPRQVVAAPMPTLIERNSTDAQPALVSTAPLNKPGAPQPPLRRFVATHPAIDDTTPAKVTEAAASVAPAGTTDTAIADGVANNSLVSSATADDAQPSEPVSNNAAPPLAQVLADPGKSIRRIVIFYQDGTFTDYRPEAN